MAMLKMTTTTVRQNTGEERPITDDDVERFGDTFRKVMNLSFYITEEGELSITNGYFAGSYTKE